MNNYKINYVIATYNSKGKRCHKNPLPEDILKCHIEKIMELNQNISQITIMKANSDNYYKNYYDLDKIIKKINIPIIVIDCENYGYSAGQWLKAYELFTNKFDFYIFIEDDYCPGMNNFDDLLIECYKYKFPKNLGLLCSLVEGSSNYKNGGYPIHFEGAVILNTFTLEKLYNFPKWNNNPRKYLDLIDKNTDPNFNWNRQKLGYKGGYYQLTFSHLFTLTDIKHEDYLDIINNNYLLQFIYWSDNNSIYLGGDFRYYVKGGNLKYTCTLKDIENCPIIPIQIKDISCINYNNCITK